MMTKNETDDILKHFVLARHGATNTQLHKSFKWYGIRTYHAPPPSLHKKYNFNLNLWPWMLSNNSHFDSKIHPIENMKHSYKTDWNSIRSISRHIINVAFLIFNRSHNKKTCNKNKHRINKKWINWIIEHWSFRWLILYCVEHPSKVYLEHGGKLRTFFFRSNPK